MVMVADLVPGQRFLRPLALRKQRQEMVVRLMLAFILHVGRMSCLQAGGGVRCEPRHRAQVGRSLGRKHWLKSNLNDSLRALVLAMESKDGLFVAIFDATLWSQPGQKTENRHSTGNRTRRPHRAMQLARRDLTVQERRLRRPARPQGTRE
jgi:hypothetical protein